MSDPLRVKGTLYKGAGAGRILCVDPGLWVRRSSPWGQAGIAGLGSVLGRNFFLTPQRISLSFISIKIQKESCKEWIRA